MAPDNACSHIFEGIYAFVEPICVVDGTGIMPEVMSTPWLRNIEAFLLDMDGTLVLGERMLPGAAAFIELLRKRGLRFLILTNNSSRNADDYADGLRNIGISIAGHEVYTSGDATIDYLKGKFPEKRVYLLGTSALVRQFHRAGIQLSDVARAEAIVVAFDTTVTYEKLKNACELVRVGMPYIATHPDLNCPTEAGPIPDVGAVLAFIKASTGRSPDIVIGKPHPPMIESVERFLELPARRMCMVGDRLYTDIALGQHGVRTVLVLSGEAKRADLREAIVQPDLVVEDVDALAMLLEERD
jgi:HAD superfamily hydrolase (TIGR01450 family)